MKNPFVSAAFSYQQVDHHIISLKASGKEYAAVRTESLESPDGQKLPLRLAAPSSISQGPERLDVRAGILVDVGGRFSQGHIFPVDLSNLTRQSWI